MNNWKLRAVVTDNQNMDLYEANGYLARFYNSDVSIAFVPFGDKFPHPLRTTATDDFGPVSNQVPGICNGTFTHTGAGSATVSATTLSGNGANATFQYTFLADGTLSTIVAISGGSGYLVGDKLRITTSASHGSQVIEFFLVDGSNACLRYAILMHDRTAPGLPFPVHKFRINNADDRAIHILDYRSSQVFPKPQDKLLDKYPDAAAAYSFRKLRSAYLGPAIRVRSEASGFPEIDVYFDSQGNLDTATLLDFAGSSSVRIKKWYDQSGNGNDLEQTTNEQQARIVAGGTLQTDDDGNVYANCSDAQYSLGTAVEQPFTALAVAELGTYNRLFFSPLWSPTNVVNRANFGAELLGLSAWNANEKNLYGVLANGASSELRLNGLQDNAGNLGTTDLSSSTKIFTQTQPSSAGAPRAYEMVIWESDQSANFDPIEKDMGSHYKTQGMEDAPLLDAYGGAHAAYSLRKLNSDYTGAAVRIARDSDLAEQDIGFDADGNLDTAAAIAFCPSQYGRIKKWYDQSGNDNDITQSSQAGQPILVEQNNSVITVDGQPSLRFFGTDDSLPFDNTDLDIGNLSSFIVCKFGTTTGDQQALSLSGTSGDARWFAPRLVGGNFNYTVGTSSSVGTATATTANNLHTCIAGATQTDTEAFLNGTSVGTKALGSGIDSNLANIGSRGTSAYMNGFIQEVVVYSSDQSERRLGIERNISNHYDL